MSKKWYWFLGFEDWRRDDRCLPGFQVGLGVATVHWDKLTRWSWWWNRD